ncbi:MAG: hypothetical protein KDI82_15155 [Gammaproteobacteria bacterium]|nr:hypothetical protein [Gammaproteobacteria bacterium]
MLPLLRYFLGLALLRRGPQDLPSSSFLLLLAAALGVLVGGANGVALFGGVAAALAANLLDLVLSLTMLLVVLQLRGHPARWLQTATAFQGLGALAGLSMLLLRPPLAALGLVDVAVLIDLLLMVWLQVALGGVIRHALDLPLAAGVMIVLVYTVVAFSLVTRVFPPVIGP